MPSMFEPVFMRLALIASVATGASLGLIGVYLAFRRVVFLGLVLANAATVGAAVAEVFDWSPEITSIIAAVAVALNSRPRKTLAWKTPAEALDQLLISATSGDIRN